MHNGRVAGGGGRVDDPTYVDFTVTAGRADGTSDDDKKGAGMWIVNCDAVTLNNCIFTNCYADHDGGAIRILVPSTGLDASEVTILNCQFIDNESHHQGGALFYFNDADPTDPHNLTIEDTLFDGNDAVEGAQTTQNGGAIAVHNANDVTVTNCDFDGNTAHDYGGAVYIVATGSVTFEEMCTFTENEALNELGGAIYFANVNQMTVEDSTFLENEAEKGGGAIWLLTERSDGTERHNVFNADNCDFLRNVTQSTTHTADGGGAIFLSGNANTGDYDGVISGTISNCDFFGNESLRGGAMYLHSCGGVVSSTPKQLHVRDCRFVANEAFRTSTGGAGGALGIGNDNGVTGTDVRICKSLFVSNIAEGKGGAIHNHEGAVTYMVNCILAGNSSFEQGGGIFNSRHTGSADVPAELYLHNCLIAGNMASSATTSLDIGGGVFNGLGSDEAAMEMVHCTVFGNFAGQSYGGVVSVSDDPACRLYFYNSISRDNADGDGNTDAFEEDLLHVANYVDGDVSNFVAEGSLPAIYDDNPTWTASDPVFNDDGSSQTWTGSAAYDGDTGQTEFTFSTCPSIGPGDLFRPSASDYRMLLVVSHDESGPNCIVTCWGYWSGSGTTGTGFDLHIGTSGSAYNFGGDYLPEDKCDVDGNMNTGEDLPIDLYGNSREQSTAPDAGVHEATPP